MTTLLQVFFYKRAQIFVGDVHGALGGKVRGSRGKTSAVLSALLPVSVRNVYASDCVCTMRQGAKLPSEAVVGGWAMTSCDLLKHAVSSLPQRRPPCSPSAPVDTFPNMPPFTSHAPSTHTTVHARLT